MADNFLVTMQSGRLSALGGHSVLIDQTTADAQGWKVGEALTGTAGALTAQRLVVGGIYRDSQAFGSHMIVDRSLYAAALPVSQRADARVFVRAVPGANLPLLRSELTELVRPYLNV